MSLGIARRGTYRVFYRFHNDTRTLAVLAVTHAATPTEPPDQGHQRPGLVARRAADRLDRLLSGVLPPR